MKILILNGSPHKKGTSALLISEFKRGAEENGHQVTIFDTASETIHPCIACDHCRTSSSGCVFQDGMETLNPMLMDADLVVFSTPLYYFGMSAQIKAVIDRLYANNQKFRDLQKKAILLATCGDTDSWAMDALKHHYETVCHYLGWEDCGSLLGIGMYTRDDIENSTYPEKAYEFGKSICDMCQEH